MQPDDSRAYVSCSRGGYVAVIDLKTMDVVGRIDAGPRPDGCLDEQALAETRACWITSETAETALVEFAAVTIPRRFESYHGLSPMSLDTIRRTAIRADSASSSTIANCW
jgi:hypothetical protein